MLYRVHTQCYLVHTAFNYVKESGIIAGCFFVYLEEQPASSVLHRLLASGGSLLFLDPVRTTAHSSCQRDCKESIHGGGAVAGAGKKEKEEK